MSASDNGAGAELRLESRAEGVVLWVRAQPGARRSGVTGVHDGALCVAVTAPADRGKANEALRRVLAERLRVAPSSVELLSGATSRQKRFLVRGGSVAALAALASEG